MLKPCPNDEPMNSLSECADVLLELDLQASPLSATLSCPCSLPAGLVEHSDLDERAIEALKEFDEEGALQVLVQFKESDLSHVQVRALALAVLGVSA